MTANKPPQKSNAKSFADFNAKDWKNFGIYVILVGLFIAFVGKEWRIGRGVFAVGFIFTLLFQGKKIFKILKRE